MANLIGNSLFTGAITGLNSNYLLMLGANKTLSMEDILTSVKDKTFNAYAVNQNFRSYILQNFNKIDMDADGKISTQDITNYSNQLQTHGMTYQELAQLCASNGSSTMSSLLDTVLSNFNKIDANHDGRITQAEINAYRIGEELKDVKDKYKTDPSKLSMFVETDVKSDKTESETTNKVFR